MRSANPGRQQGRRPLEQRCFISPVVEQFIQDVKQVIVNPDLAALFANAFPNTLDTTVTHLNLDGEPDTFIITGDIPAMWLRDSCAQIWPYLAFVNEDPAVDRLFQGLIRRQAKCLRLDPHPNAFYRDTRESPWSSDRTCMNPGVHERKWELDSMGYFMRLSYGYWRESSNTAPFDETWLSTLKLCYRTIKSHMSYATSAAYRFQRASPRPTESLVMDGQGQPFQSCGLVASAFRPSDDACMLPFLIPANFHGKTRIGLPQYQRLVKGPAALFYHDGHARVRKLERMSAP